MIRAIIYLLGLCTLGLIMITASFIMCISNNRLDGYAEKGKELAKEKLTEAVRSALDEGDRPAEPKPEDISAPPAVSEEKPGEPSAQKRTHIVRAGDTLFSLARWYYGDGRRWKEIARVNGIDDPSHLNVGMKLEVPR